MTTVLSRLRRAWRRLWWRDACAGCRVSGEGELCPVERDLAAVTYELTARKQGLRWRGLVVVQVCPHRYPRRYQ